MVNEAGWKVASRPALWTLVATQLQAGCHWLWTSLWSLFCKSKGHVGRPQRAKASSCVERPFFGTSLARNLFSTLLAISSQILSRKPEHEECDAWTHKTRCWSVSPTRRPGKN